MKTYLIFGAILLVLLAIVLYTMFQPYCTTWSDGGMTCRQSVWGGTKFWSVK